MFTIQVYDTPFSLSSPPPASSSPPPASSSPPPPASSSSPPSPALIEVNFPYKVQQVTVCAGQSVQITWKGTHNLIETESAECSSATVQTIESNFYDPGHTEIYDNLGASEGATRYFKCTPHCGNGARLEFSCPSPLIK